MKKRRSLASLVKKRRSLVSLALVALALLPAACAPCRSSADYFCQRPSAPDEPEKHVNGGM
jgi:hypothetical protein